MNITINGVIIDLYGRTIMGPVKIVGEVMVPGPGLPPPGTGIWPNPPEGQAPLPSHPIALPGDPWWGQDLKPTHPIVIPPDQAPTPPDMPPGTTAPVPPPAGQDGWPVQPIQPPPYIVINYPGKGPIYVTPPAA